MVHGRNRSGVAGSAVSVSDLAGRLDRRRRRGYLGRRVGGLRRVGLLVASAWLAAGCGLSFSDAPDNGEILQRLATKYERRSQKKQFMPQGLRNAKKGYAEARAAVSQATSAAQEAAARAELTKAETYLREHQVAVRVAVAPVVYDLKKNVKEVAASESGLSGSGAEAGAEKPGAGADGGTDGSGSSTEGADGEQGNAAPTDRAPNEKTGYFHASRDGGIVAVRFRRPLYRQLLFSPIDPSLRRGARDLARRLRKAQGGKVPTERGVLYKCARCMNNVGATSERCPFCGLAFAPEPEGPAPAVTPPETPTTPTTPTIPATTPPGIPPTQIVGGPNPEGPERFRCHKCGRDVPPDATVCPICLTPYFASPLEMQGEPIRDLPEGEFFAAADGSLVYSPDAFELQEQIAQAMRDYGLLQGVRNMRETNMGHADLLTIAWNEGDTLLLEPKLKRCDIRYRGLSTLRFVGNTALWVFPWLPSLWWPGAEQYEVTVELELSLFHARTGKAIAKWNTRYVGKEMGFVNQVDRGWYPWSNLGVPAGFFLQGGREDVFKAFYPLALAKVKEQLLDQLYASFVESPAIIPKAVQARNVALLIGVDSVELAQAKLDYVENDINAMQKVFTEVSRFAPAKGAEGQGRSRTSGEVVRMDTVQAVEQKDHMPTLANVRAWLTKELPKLDRVDNFIFYFAGYGAAKKVDDTGTLWGDGYEKYLCFKDTDPNNLPGTALSMTELNRILDDARCRQVLVILDTSFAVQADVEEASSRTLKGIDIDPDEVTLTNDFLEELGRRGSGKRCAVIAASSFKEPAYEADGVNENEGGGVLTDAFVRGVRGAADEHVKGNNDGKVRVAEAFDFTKDAARDTGSFVVGERIDVQTFGKPKRVGILLKPKTTG